METSYKQLEGNRIELSVTIAASVIEKALAAAYAKANENRIKGFRKGKAPRNVLDKVFGGSDYFIAEATEEAIQASYLQAIDVAGFVPLDSPDMSTIEPAVTGEDYTYSFTFTVSPELELSSYTPVEIELPSEEPTAEEIQSRVDTMLGYYAEYLPVTDRPSQVGDTLTLTIETTLDGERYEGLSGDNVPYEIGIEAMPDDFESNFIGIEAGDEVSFDFTMPFSDGADGGNEQELHVEATCNDITFKFVPELTDEWAQEKLEYESAEHFRQLIADSIRDQNQAAMPSLKQRRVAEAVAKRLEGEVPELLISEMSQDIFSDIFVALQQQGITLDAYLSSMGEDVSTFRDSVQLQAIENARQVLALDAWARHQGFEVTEDDIRAEFEKAEVDDIEADIEQWTEIGRMTEIRRGILRMKASQQLNDEAIVSEEKPKTDEEKAAEAAARAEALAEIAAAREAASNATSSVEHDHDHDHDHDHEGHNHDDHDHDHEGHDHEHDHDDHDHDHESHSHDDHDHDHEGHDHDDHDQDDHDHDDD